MVRYPRLAVGFAIAVTCLLVLNLTLATRQAHRGFAEFIQNEFRLNNLSKDILYHDEVLTMSALVGAATGDVQWEDRYRRFVIDHDRAFEQATKLATDIFTEEKTQPMEAAEDELTEMEDTIFAQIREGQSTAALELLFSPRYIEQRQIYQQGLYRILGSIQARIQQRTVAFQQGLRLTQATAAGGLVCLVGLWGWIYRILNRYATVLKRTNQNLEATVQARTQEIQHLNAQLQSENQRLSSELEVSRRLQSMILPRAQELAVVPDLDIVGFMEPATEVGGDYFDVIYQDGCTVVSIGDVTGHGLESGVLMLMVQTAIRSLLAGGERDLTEVLKATNQAVFANVQRMGSEKSLSLLLMRYEQGVLTLSGQHEHLLIFRQGGDSEAYDTDELGFTVGLLEDISPFMGTKEMPLQVGDMVALYTDGFTEAENAQRQMYGLPRLQRILAENAHFPVAKIQQAVLQDVRSFIGAHTVYDDLTLVLLKRQR